MGRPGADERDNTKVRECLVPRHLVLVRVGSTVQVQTNYAGVVSVTLPKERPTWGGGDPKRTKADQYKCVHCPALFSGDARRLARHFLPERLPPDFWGKGAYRGVCACTACPPEVPEELASLNCSEFLKLRAILDGDKDACALPAMGTKRRHSGEAVLWAASSPESGSSSSLGEPRSFKDPARFREALLRGTDVPRLLSAALLTGGIPLRFAENPFFRRAFEVVGLHSQLPYRGDFAVMRGAEAEVAREDNRQWCERVEFVTLAADGRKMHESQHKESMMNFSIVARGQERYLRSADMSGMEKKTQQIRWRSWRQHGWSGLRRSACTRMLPPLFRQSVSRASPWISRL